MTETYTAERLDELLRRLDQVVADNTVGGDGLTYIGALAKQSADALTALVKEREVLLKTSSRLYDERGQWRSRAEAAEAELAKLREALERLDTLSLVIESAVRNADIQSARAFLAQHDPKHKKQE